MDNKQHFKKYLAKLRFEAFLKSLFSGLAVGFIANFIAALVTWFTPYNELWISLAALGVVTVVATAIFYFKTFYPSVMANARRLDKLGLEERLITMVEYENDDSYMASAQREDAKAVLNTVNSKSIKLSIARKIWVSLVVCMLLGIGMTTVSVLAVRGVLPGGDDLIESIIPEEPEVYIALTYDVEEGGYIEGEQDQLVLLGSNGSPVEAIADDGYVFVQWSDGSTKPYRTDKELEADIEVFAIFEPADGGGEGEGEGDGEGEGEGDGEGMGEGNGSGEGEGEGQGEGNGNGEGSGEGEGDGNGTTGGGKYDHSNQIIDGETYYREVLDEYKDQLAQYLEEHRDELTEDEIAVIEQYLDIV